ncbi:tetrathionate reductase family octaheme c-type cytochrome [Nitrincola iocasae]|uniref:Tetrathionate reductase family octaheme c-type cytochrome n=1 Tax=Nitrincola iocasae TaxID=2614693 RepID=A0A5J6LGM9_9GAMM|nr:tetrathionate reductase family octaheme c-type cytochrome [Nitrincola iocasae]QEW07351.1 tetrathionate reductase family octaheme c-type cytochrome [Nitrincola iocasae]
MNKKIKWLRYGLSALLLVPVTLAVASSTADHSQFEALQGPFSTGQEVTAACLSCHTEAASQIMKTRHWTWEYPDPLTGEMLGKKTMINGFCIGDRSNEAFCQSCHIGYGWEDDTFDFNEPTQVDCLACHNTGEYKKIAGMAGHPAYENQEWPEGSGKFLEAVDLVSVAQEVGPTSRETCGSCHFYGGGGDGVKHGDLDSSLVHASHELDVHMAEDGLNFSCSDCHQTDEHQVPGSRTSMTAADTGPAMMRGHPQGDRNPASCQSCHGSEPHESSFAHASRLNQHAETMACQTCHIPAFARGGVPTKMGWDWSEAGRLTEDGKPFVTRDETGHAIYDSRKGSFVLGENVQPVYQWFDGRVDYMQPDTVIDPSSRVPINQFLGEPGAANARIWPVKLFHGKQPYDTELKTLLVPEVAIPNDTAFWYNFDWDKALKEGAEASGRPFSGQYDFVETSMVWPITHMVAPKEQALDCASCHADASRLEGVAGIWMPGHHRYRLLDWLGFSLAGLIILGSAVHGSLRVLTRNKGRGH